jgi:lipopolysaccharide transport system ATP-binding protein
MGLPMSSEPCIVVNDVSKKYQLYNKPSDRLWQALWGRRSLFKEFVAVQNISFQLQKGEVLGIVGVNGAGKSTLLQLIAGTIQPTSGTVQVQGRVAALLELGSGFNPEFTGRENIYLNAATLGLSKAEIDQKIDEIIAFAGIGHHIDQPVKTYSSGMHVRLAFSIATSVEPDILIIDEALSVGDGAFARSSFDRIMQIKERGATVLFCSHTLYHVEVFCDRALWLHQGQVRALAPVSLVLSQYQEFLDTLTEPTQNIQAGTSSETPAEAPARHPTNDLARIESVTVALDGQEGKELFGDSGVSQLRMRIDFHSDPCHAAPSAALVLSSEGGRILATHMAQAHGYQFERDATGRGRAEIVVNQLPFNKGRYRIGAYLMCEQGIHVYQWIDPVAHVQLHHPGNDQGYFLLKAEWNTPQPSSIQEPH